MSIESTLYSTLNGDSAVRALVSSGSPLVHRIFPQIAEDGTALPYITYQVVATEAHNILSGAPDTERKVIQINCISDTYLEAKTLAEAVKAALNVSIGYLNGEGDDYFSSTQNHRVRLDFALIG